MDLGETIDFDEEKGDRAPPCKRPRRTDEVLRGLDSPDVVGPQTVSCPMGPQNMFVPFWLQGPDQLILVKCGGNEPTNRLDCEGDLSLCLDTITWMVRGGFMNRHIF